MVSGEVQKNVEDSNGFLQKVFNAIFGKTFNFEKLRGEDKINQPFSLILFPSNFVEKYSP